jgi:hypothetical protein
MIAQPAALCYASPSSGAENIVSAPCDKVVHFSLLSRRRLGTVKVRERRCVALRTPAQGDHR